MVFEAKVDTWFLAVFYGFGLGMLLAAPWMRSRPRGTLAAVLLAGLGIVFIGIGWRAASVDYVITTDGYLDATGWPFDGRIGPIDAITSVQPSSDARGSHAASLDRLRVDFANGALIFIAVEDEPGFLDAMAAADAGLVRAGQGLAREGR